MKSSFVVALALLPGCAAPRAAWDPQHPSPQGPPPPALRAPSADARVTSARPRFQWRRPAGESAVLVQVCRDRGCAHVAAQAEVTQDSWTPDVDLPSGLFYWRAFGKSGARKGQRASDTRAFAVDDNVVWTGAHVELVLARAHSDYGQQLVTKLDAAVELYAQLLGVRVPAGTTPLLLYTSNTAYDRVNSDNPYELGVTVPQRRDALGIYDPSSPPTKIHVRFGEQAGISLDAGETGLVEETALHELAHAVQMASVFHYLELPAWWIEGLSDFLASRAARDIFGVPYARQQTLASRVRDVVQASAAHTLLPIAELLTVDIAQLQRMDGRQASLLYAQSFCILHVLDREQPAALAQALRSVANMTSLSGASTQLRQLTGEPRQFEPRWLASLREEPLSPWLIRSAGATLRTTADALVVSVPVGVAGRIDFSGATAASLPQPPPAGARLEAAIDARADTSTAHCLLVETRPGAPYVACVNNGRGEAWLRNQATKALLGTIKFAPRLLTAGTPHLLSLELGADRWTLRLDDVVTLPVPAPQATVSGWGVGGAGRARYGNVQLVAPVAP